MRARNLSCILTTLSILLTTKTLFAQGTAFTYQGRLNVGTGAANGSYDLNFALFNVSAGAGQIGSTLTSTATPVSNGLFAVTLDFGNEFPGADRWLEISVRTNGGGVFTTLTPRQKITATPYAIRAAGVDAAGLTGTIPSSSLSGTYSEPLTFDNTANSYSGTFYGQFMGLTFLGGSFAGSFIGNGSGLGNLNASQLLSGTIPSAALGNSWRTIGNAGTTPATHFLGTTDNQPLELRVNNRRILRLEPNVNNSPNILAGSVSNSIGAGVEGSTIAGGGIGLYPNTITANYATIGGGTFHMIGGAWSTIAGGRDNVVEADHSSIGGGRGNHIWPSAAYVTIAGGVFNAVSTNSNYSVIGGGYNNSIEHDSFAASIQGGYNNHIFPGSPYAWIAGGAVNNIRSNASHSAIGAGGNNSIGINSSYSVIAGGFNNQIFDDSGFATIAGGSDNTATGFAFAAGRRAKAAHPGAFVWADSQDADFFSNAGNEVSFRCLGGVRFTSGSGAANQTVSWTPGSAAWSFTSDRNSKENLHPVDAGRVLEKIAGLPLHEWQYIGYRQRHIGPMAQDFHAAFPLNDSDTTLNDADLHGVALAAIQGLNEKVEGRRQKSEDRIQKLETENADLKQRLEKLENLLQNHR